MPRPSLGVVEGLVSDLPELALSASGWRIIRGDTTPDTHMIPKTTERDNRVFSMV